MKKAANCMSLAAFVRPNGRNERIRTSDPFVPNEVRYQAAPHSEISVAARSSVNADAQAIGSPILSNTRSAGTTEVFWRRQWRAALPGLLPGGRLPARRWI